MASIVLKVEDYLMVGFDEFNLGVGVNGVNRLEGTYEVHLMVGFDEVILVVGVNGVNCLKGTYDVYLIYKFVSLNLCILEFEYHRI